MTPFAKAAFAAFQKTWREARRWDHVTMELAWSNAAQAAIDEYLKQRKETT
jgi:hypothetical protein